MDELHIDRELLERTFLAEAEETLTGMEQALVALESRPADDELLHTVFRAAHTLKGGAALVAFDAVRELAHDVEGVLERLRAHTLAVSDGVVTLLLESVDALRGAVERAAGGERGTSSAAASLRARLAQAAHADAHPAPAPAEARPGTPAAAATARTLRVDLAKLDRMLDLSGEIAIARGRLADMLERRAGLTQHEILAAHRDADRLHGDLQELIMKARMVPIGPVFHQQARTVRDVATAGGKQARLVVEDEEVEVDTAIVEHLRDPLTHMVRNAVDHGIERPEVRRGRGKDPCGRVTLRAAHEGGTIVVEVLDDGGGLDRGRIAERAAAAGLVGEPARASDDELHRLVFEPGFTTSEQVTEISGRGVGMDVVRRKVEALRGSVGVRSEPGRGTAFTIRLPLTLAIIQGFRVAVSGERYVLPLDSVVECVELPASERGGGGFGVLNLRGRPLPYLRLREHLGVGGSAPARENVVVVRHAMASAGLAVDALEGESQTVVKPLGPLLRGLPGIAGSAILGDGRVALVLDVPGLLRAALARAANA